MKFPTCNKQPQTPIWTHRHWYITEYHTPSGSELWDGPVNCSDIQPNYRKATLFSPASR